MTKIPLAVKNGPTPASFQIFSSFQTRIISIFTTNKCEKRHVHSVFGAGIRTHNLWNMSLLP